MGSLHMTLGVDPQTPHRVSLRPACGRTIEEVERALDRDNFMSADQAKSWGIVDEVCAR